MCAKNAKQSLESVKGIEAADVRLDEERAILLLTEDHTVTTDTLRTTVEEAGYEFRAARFGSPEKASGG